MTNIEMQPTTKFVDEQGPSIKPNNFVKKDDYKEEIKNYATIKLMNDSLDNKISALDNYYYDKDYIDGQLSCKSNTSHNHNNLYAKREHMHSFNELDDKPELALANHSHSYKSLTDIPQTFTPAEHKHRFNDLMGKVFKFSQEAAETDYIFNYDSSDFFNKWNKIFEINGKGIILNIKFFDNVGISVTETGIIIKVGTKEYKFTAILLSLLICVNP